MDSGVTIDKVLQQASDLAGWLHEQLWDYAVPANPRSRLAGACFAAVQDHHDAIATLIEKRLHSSAFALVRVLFEAYVRGSWLANCATGAELKAFQKDAKPPSISRQLQALEAFGLGDGNLSKVKKCSWDAMNSYTHTGMRQIQRWNTVAGIEPNFQAEEIIQAIQFAGTFMLLSGLGIASLNGDTALSRRILEKCIEWVANGGAYFPQVG